MAVKKSPVRPALVALAAAAPVVIYGTLAVPASARRSPAPAVTRSQAPAVAEPQAPATAKSQPPLAAGRAAAARGHAAQPNTVTVRVQGVDRTLLAPTAVRIDSGWVTSFGAPAGKCPAASAQGALNAATDGHWFGKWSSEYSEYFVTRILGDLQPGSTDFWALYVNGRLASTGACDTTAHAGDTILFAAVPSKGRTPEVIGISLPARARVGQSVRARVVYYTPKGVRRPLAGARVRIDGRQLRTNASGRTRALTVRAPGVSRVVATKRGFITGVALIVARR